MLLCLKHWRSEKHKALAEDLYITNIDVASDRKIVIEATKEGSVAPYGAMIDEIIDRAGLFNSCFFSH